MCVHKLINSPGSWSGRHLCAHDRWEAPKPSTNPSRPSRTPSTIKGPPRDAKCCPPLAFIFRSEQGGSVVQCFLNKHEALNLDPQEPLRKIPGAWAYLSAGLTNHRTLSLVKNPGTHEHTHVYTPHTQSKVKKKKRERCSWL